MNSSRASLMVIMRATSSAKVIGASRWWWRIGTVRPRRTGEYFRDTPLLVMAVDDTDGDSYRNGAERPHGSAGASALFGEWPAECMRLHYRRFACGFLQIDDSWRINRVYSVPY